MGNPGTGRWYQAHTTLELLDMVNKDITMLRDGEWVPDDASCQATLDVIFEIKRRVRNRA
jgi:hypothetical protein